MRIFVFGTRGFPGVQGGVEKHCQELYTRMPASFQITVFRRKAFLAPHAEKHYENIHFIDLVSTKIKGFESFFHSFLCTVVCLLKRPDLVHIHNIGPGIFTPFLRMAGIPVVLTFHSPNYEHKKWGKVGRFILRMGETLSLKYANRLIFVNRFQREKYTQKIKDKSLYIANGIETPGLSERTDYIESLGLRSRHYILAVGRITQEKGFDSLIEAYLPLKDKDISLVIAGTADYKQEFAVQVMQKAKENGVVMPGFVSGESLRQLYSHARLFVLPSYSEGFPLVLLEAMGYHLPVVVSDIPGNRQLDLPEEVYFTPGDCPILSHKMEEKIRSFSPVSYDLTKYSWKDIASSTMQVYNDI